MMIARNEKKIIIMYICSKVSNRIVVYNKYDNHSVQIIQFPFRYLLKAPVTYNCFRRGQALNDKERLKYRKRE